MSIELDPQIAEALAPLAAGGAPLQPLDPGDIAGRRARLDPMLTAINTMQAPADDVSTTDYNLDTPDGPIRLRWYTKDQDSSPGSAVLYFHGGGMILGSIDAWDGPLSRIVSRSGVPFLSVDYRLAPEHPYPAALHDAEAALRWLHKNAEELGVDPTRIAVMGNSGGGGLAAALAINSRDHNGPTIARQLLLFPMLDDRTTTPDPGIAPYAAWTYDDNRTGWQAYLGTQAGASNTAPTAAPARAADLSELPDTYIEAGQLDIFRDENIAYAVALSHAGVNTELHLWSGAPHEFDVIAYNSDAAHAATANRVRALRAL